MTNPTPEHKEQAREIVESVFGKQGGNPIYQTAGRLIEELRTKFASALASRDAEALVVCGNENKVGGCGDQVSTSEGFRCADCLSWFHRDCIDNHFEMDAYVKKLRELREQGAIDDWKDAVSKAETALTSRDADVREVLEGLSTLIHYTHGQPERCWCNNQNSNWTHTQECLAARELYAKLSGGSS